MKAPSTTILQYTELAESAERSDPRILDSISLLQLHASLGCCYGVELKLP